MSYMITNSSLSPTLKLSYITNLGKIYMFPAVLVKKKSKIAIKTDAGYSTDIQVAVILAKMHPSMKPVPAICLLIFRHGSILPWYMIAP